MVGGTLGGGEEWEPVVGMYYMTEEYSINKKKDESWVINISEMVI